MAEFRATKAALVSIENASFGKGVFLRVTPDDVALAIQRLEGTYFLRLTAEAERAMRLHMLQHFPQVKLTNRDGFGSLIAKCAKYFDPTNSTQRMPAHLVAEVLALNEYRNDQAHSLQMGFTFPALGTARMKLSRFLYALP